MYEKIKSWISNNRFLIGMGVGAVLFLACYLFSGRSTTADNAITDTVQSIKSDNKSAGAAIDRAVREIRSAGADITGAVENVERAERIIEQNTGTVEECRDIVSTLKVLSGEAKSILADVERANKEAEGR